MVLLGKRREVYVCVWGRGGRRQVGGLSHGVVGFDGVSPHIGTSIIIPC